jgi:hypothetical protein
MNTLSRHYMKLAGEIDRAWVRRQKALRVADMNWDDRAVRHRNSDSRKRLASYNGQFGRGLRPSAGIE